MIKTLDQVKREVIAILNSNYPEQWDEKNGSISLSPDSELYEEGSDYSIHINEDNNTITINYTGVLDVFTSDELDKFADHVKYLHECDTEVLEDEM